MVEIAWKRVDAVWAGYKELRGKPGAHRSLSILVGYFCDLHVPLLLDERTPKTVRSIYRDRLSPDQSGAFPVAIGGPPETRHELEATLEHHVEGMISKCKHPQSPIVKLFAKGKPFPRSVRYIRPQLERCAETQDCAKVVEFMLKVHELKSANHHQTDVAPRQRMAIYRTELADLIQAVVVQPSKHLYGIVSEFIAIQLINSVRLLMRAEAAWGGDLTSYIDAALTGNRDRTVTGPVGAIDGRPAVSASLRFKTAPSSAEDQVAFVREVQRQLQINKVHVIPLHPIVRTVQRTRALAMLGIPDIEVCCCDLCGILHCRTVELKPRGGKLRTGVSMDLGSETISCNSCNQSAFVRRINLIGNIVRCKRTLADKKISIIGVCCTCSKITADLHFRYVHPYCINCYRNNAPGHAAPLLCVCGDRHDTSIEPMLCRVRGVNVFSGICKHHAGIFGNMKSSRAVPSLAECRKALALYLTLSSVV